MMSDVDFIIPVDEQVNDFLGHLDANPRTILSSRFGDGKSFFLQRLKENEDAKAKYEFITLYPVNYQVADNKDVFDLIKVDLLFQLFCHKMIPETMTISDDVALSFFIQQNGISLMETLIPFFAEVALPAEEAGAVLAAFKGLALFKELRKKFEDYKKKFNTEDKVSKFIDSINNGFLYENDVVTEIIKKGISEYKENTGKKVVLIVEDLDRIDPAHLFRILNLLSAHIDNSYRYAIQPKGLIGNKFELDNVVLVVHYDNLESIFHHFYGEKTCFEGYITKFLSSKQFEYSLKETCVQYYKNEIQRLTGAPSGLIELLDASIFEDKTIREVINAFDIENQIKRDPIYKCGEDTVKLDTTILKLLSLMRRFKKSDTVILDYLKAIERQNVSLYLKYVCPYAFLAKKCTGMICDVTTIVDGSTNEVEVQLSSSNGQCSVQGRYYNPTVRKTDVSLLAKTMLKYINK